MYWLLIIPAVLLVWLFLVCPTFRKHSAREEIKGKYVAHRGLHTVDPEIYENTLEAFLYAAEKGYIIENDIHLTKDGEVVIFHDDNLLRMCGVDKEIENLTLKEIKGYKIKGKFEIPTLRECLNAVNGAVPLLIEFKANFKNYKKLCEKANEELKNYNGKYYVQSFYPLVLNWYKKHRPDVMRGQLSTAFLGEELYKRLAGALLFNFLSRPDFISYEHTHKNRFNRKICTYLGAYPVGWTFANQSEIDNSKEDFCTYIFETFIPRT